MESVGRSAWFYRTRYGDAPALWYHRLSAGLPLRSGLEAVEVVLWVSSVCPSVFSLLNPDIFYLTHGEQTIGVVVGMSRKKKATGMKPNRLAEWKLAI
jgi:hypothetical protein